MTEDPLRNCGPIGSPGPSCSICARCVAETRAAENGVLRDRIALLEAVLSFYASSEIMMLIGGDRGNAARKVLAKDKQGDPVIAARNPTKDIG
jgi:hypothetical protein